MRTDRGVLLFPSCNDFLDREPLDQVTPESYFQNADHLAAYSISQYQSLFSTHGGFNAGTVNNDGATDNMVSGESSGSGVQNYYTKDDGKQKQPMATGISLSSVIATTSLRKYFPNMKQAKYRVTPMT